MTDELNFVYNNTFGMKVIDNRLDENEIQMKELCPGAIFLFKNEIYMKIYGFDKENRVEYNAVNLRNGKVKYIQKVDNIKPIKTKLIIKKNI